MATVPPIQIPIEEEQLSNRPPVAQHSDPVVAELMDAIATTSVRGVQAVEIRDVAGAQRIITVVDHSTVGGVRRS